MTEQQAKRLIESAWRALAILEREAPDLWLVGQLRARLEAVS